MRIISLIFSLMLCFASFAQSYNYAVFCKDTLTSRYMAGRAYIDNGDKKAANFIRNELRNNAVSLMGDDGFQYVDISVNNILDARLKIGSPDRSLKVGEEFLVFGSSPACNIELKNVKPLFFNTKSELEKVKSVKLNNKVLVFNSETLSYRDIALFLRTLVKEGVKPDLVVIQAYDKIQYYVGNSVLPFAVLQLKGKPISKKIPYLSLQIGSKYEPRYRSQNVWAMVEGTKYADSCFVFVSHYDHLGKVGDVYFPGANDNASGVSVLLDMAAYYAKYPAEYSVVFLFVTGEEIGLVGSSFAAKNPLIDLSKIKFLFNLDMMGTGSTGLAVINGQKELRAGKLLQTINDENHLFAKVVLGEESCNSDHCPFVMEGVSSHFLFTYGCEYNEYHTVYDDGKDLHFTKHIDLCNLLKEFIRRY